MRFVMRGRPQPINRRMATMSEVTARENGAQERASDARPPSMLPTMIPGIDPASKANMSAKFTDPISQWPMPAINVAAGPHGRCRLRRCGRPEGGGQDQESGGAQCSGSDRRHGHKDTEDGTQQDRPLGELPIAHAAWMWSPAQLRIHGEKPRCRPGRRRA